MCTAAVYKTKDFYFGRNLDYEFPYGEEVTVTPRNYPFSFRFQGEMKQQDVPDARTPVSAEKHRMWLPCRIC